MATILATASTAFHLTTTWVGGVVPTTGDVAVANNKTIPIQQDLTCLELRNDTTGGATTGGNFPCSTAGVTITANLYSESVNILSNSCTTGTVYVIGNITGGTSNSIVGANNSSTGTLNITGNITSGSGNYASYGVANQSTGIVNIAGNVTSNLGYCVVNVAGGVITITGNVIGGNVSSSYGVVNLGNGIITINGNATGGGATLTYGANNASTGTLTVNGLAIGNDFGLGSTGLTACEGVFGSQTGNTYVKGIQYGSRGQSPTAGNVFITSDTEQNTATVINDINFGTTTLYSPDKSSQGQADPSNVRKSVSYGGTLVGTMNVPAPESVLINIPIDATVGKAYLTQDSITTAVIKGQGYHKYLTKIGTTWYLVVRDALDTTDIIKKPLKDRWGNDITYYAAGQKTAELASIV